MGDVLMGADWSHGNAAEDTRETRGWLLGHFIDPAQGVRSTRDVEVKWATHPAGDTRPEWAADDQRTTVACTWRVVITNGRTRPSTTPDSSAAAPRTTAGRRRFS